MFRVAISIRHVFLPFLFWLVQKRFECESIQENGQNLQGVSRKSLQLENIQSQHNEKQLSAISSETPDFSDFLATNGCSCEPVSSSNAITAKSNNLFSLDQPNHPNVSAIFAQKLSKRTL